MTAGILAGQIEGTTWEQIVRRRLFEPLGMLRSNFSVNDSQKSDDFALTYSSAKDKITRIPFRNIDEVGPAGSINSSVEEMIRYVQFHVDKGRSGETQLLSARNAEQMQSPQLVAPGAMEYEELGHRSYGLGLGVSSHRGNKTVEHGGGIDGFSAYLAFMPNKKAGLIILTNCTEGGTAVSIITRNVYDRLLGLNQIDWNDRARKQTEKAKQAAEEARKKTSMPRKEGTSLSHALADYAGDYDHPAYGRLKIEVQGSGLKGTYNQMTFSMKHFHYDIFEVPEDGEDSQDILQDSKIAFFYNKKGEIERVAIPLEPAVSDIVFTRAK
jgi:CubicO group peptidase (beta-lactamase class C family)